MKTSASKKLPVAVRVYAESPRNTLNTNGLTVNRKKGWRRPKAMLVFDTETRIDATQRLTFGSYRYFERGSCLEEGLFYPPDLPVEGIAALERYVAEHDVDGSNKDLKLLTLEQFSEKLYRAAYKCRCLLVGFNLPFDLSRVARSFSAARGRFAGGFSFVLRSYIDQTGVEKENRYSSRIAVKHIDSKRALKGFTGRNSCDPEDLIPEESETGKPEDGYKFRRHFLDLRTLAFALTDRGYTLAAACDAFGVEHGKLHSEHYGTITETYIDYNRRDVLATAELAEKLLAEFDRHPITLQPTKAYSPASVGKSYLQAMGIEPILERQPDFPRKYLGYAQSAFFGGRTSAHIRKVPVPVVYTDFLSMYPTVNALIGLWNIGTANKVEVIEHCQDEVQDFLIGLSAERMFDPRSWKDLTAFVRLVPDGDILPSRSKYSDVSNDWQVAVNYLHHAESNPEALWFALPDVVASVLLTGQTPKLLDAFRIVGRGKLKGLKSTRLRGEITVNPGEKDFFTAVIEERKTLKSSPNRSGAETERLGKALKTIANSTSYGIYAEMNREESDESKQVTCHGIDEKPFRCNVNHPEIPGMYCFPPLAALITSAARLMLALLEKSVLDLGGTYAMEDTDSMAIVATEKGGLVACEGGSHRIRNKPAIKALTWKQVDDIADRFEALNPYDRAAILGSVLKIEEDNFDPETQKQRQLYCFAISAKRYTLFLKDGDGNPELLRKGQNNDTDRWSEHGLGHLLNPTDPECEDRQWIGLAWLNMVRRALGKPFEALGIDDRPSIGRLSVSSPAVIKPLANLNRNKSYADQIKPFNFYLTCHVLPFGHPRGADPERFHLIAPYNTDATQWLKMDWIDQYTGETYRITTTADGGSVKAVRVKTYGDVLNEYEYHPEAKCADEEGNPCSKQTVGLLQRRHVVIDLVRYIGKESNHLEDVEAGMVHSETGAYTEYVDRSRDEWTTKIAPELKRRPIAILMQESGLSKRALVDLRAGRSRPHPKNLERLIALVRKVNSDRSESTSTEESETRP